MERIMKISALLALPVVILAFFSCSPGKGDGDRAVGPDDRVITDMKGNKIVVPKKLERVALLGGPTGQIAYILGAQDRLCAVTGSIATSELIRIFDPSIATRPTVRTVSGSVNVEELIKSDAQLVIAGDTDGEIVRSKTGIPVAYFDDSIGDRVEAIKKEIMFYASVFEAEKRGEAYNNYLDSMIAFINERISSIPENKRKVIYNGYNSNHLVTLGGDTFMQERIELAGCLNAAKEIGTSSKQEGLHSGLGEVSMELVLKWNPDIIVIDMGSLEELRNDNRWASIKAVKNGEVYTQPAGAFIWDRPTAEAAVLHPLWMAMTAYPEKFRDISFRKEIKRFYKEIFGFHLTDKHARMIEEGSFRAKIMKGAKSQ